ncbi:MAG: hypothetical protein HGA45_00355 [Chloroflexales bacterium]|nr:hypothetical protein [Chloroflexales bacterium]
MSKQSWWQRAIAAINREYERRIRRSSLVTEYGAAHHGHDHDHLEHDDNDTTEIMNVPKGTRLGRRASIEPPPGDHFPPE